MRDDAPSAAKRVSRRRLLSLGGLGGLGALLAAGDEVRSPGAGIDRSDPLATSRDGAAPGGAGDPVLDVRAFGAVGDGSTDDTAAVRAAADTGLALYFPAGRYRGSFDLDVGSPRIVGSNNRDVEILLDDDHFLVDSNQPWQGLRLENVTVRGGKGVIRNRYRGANVTDQSVVVDCQFYGYSGAAISTESSDMPMWRVERCLFQGANQVSSIGIAWNGLTDNNVVQRCEFQRNCVHIKLGHGGNNALIADNDFVQYSSPVDGERRVTIWVVPGPEATNAGSGMIVADNKFGNENQGRDDLRVLYADEGSGEHFGERLPDYRAPSSGYIVGHVIRGGVVNGTDDAPLPIVYSTTPHVRGCLIGGMALGGSMPSYVFELLRGVDALDPDTSGNTAGPFTLPDQNRSPLRVSNRPGLFHLVDPTQAFDSGGTTVLSYSGGGRPTGYVNLLAGDANSLIRTGGATGRGAVDGVGGPDAVDVSFGRAGRLVAELRTDGLQADFPIWLEFDVRGGADDPLSEMSVVLGLDAGASEGVDEILRRRVVPLQEWRPHRFLAASPAMDGRLLLQFRPAADSRGSHALIGRVRVYQSREPLPADLTLPNVPTSTEAPAAGGAAPLPAAPAGYMTVQINGVVRRIAYY